MKLPIIGNIMIYTVNIFFDLNCLDNSFSKLTYLIPFFGNYKSIFDHQKSFNFDSSKKLIIKKQSTIS